MFLGFGIDAWITIATVLGLFTILLATKCRSDIAFLGAIGVLFVESADDKVWRCADECTDTTHA